jgi:Uncharacterised nucleotidyltransferase
MNISNLLAVLMPDQNKTDFLKLCVNEFSFQQYQKLSFTDLLKSIKNERNGFKRLLSLLYFNLKRNEIEIEIENSYSAYIKTAYVREELRSSTFKNILNRTIQVLLDEKCEFILLNGASLAEPIYENWNIRHCHDIDILVKDNWLEEIASILINNGFKLENNFQNKEIKRRILKNDSGLAVTLHTNLFNHLFYNYDINSFWERAVIKKIAGHQIKVLSDTDALFHTLGKAFTNYFFSLQWATDSVFLIRIANINWNLFYENTRKSRLCIGILTMLKYLRKEFNLIIPDSLFANLSTVVNESKVLEQEAALFNATNGMKSGFIRLIRGAKNWKEKLFIIRFAILPSRASLEWNETSDSIFKINFNHLKRISSFYKND